MRYLVAVTAALSLTLTACTPHTTAATEVGVQFNKLTRKMTIADPGATYFFMPIINDWATFDVSTQNLIMAAKAERGDQKDDLRFKTRDGNDIETDVTVRWRIDPTRASYIWQAVAPTTEELSDQLVRPNARAYVRDVLNRLDSEEYYNPDLRFAAARDATNMLARQLKRFLTGLVNEASKYQQNARLHYMSTSDIRESFTLTRPRDPESDTAYTPDSQREN